MATTNFNLRNISSEVMSILKREAKKQKISVNLLILKLIEQGIGHNHEVKKSTYHDLDKLAGTWSKKDAKTFNKNISWLEKIDKDSWS